MPKISLSPFKRLMLDWQDCERCGLCKVRRKVVIAKGSIPADVMFIGEAPGESEDVIGAPFVGPAGKLLDDMFNVAKGDRNFSTFHTNLVACIPKDENTRRKNVEPLPAEIEACWPRLDRLIDLVKPRLIFAVGKLSDSYSKIKEWGKRTGEVVKLDHPAFLLRLDVVRQDLEIQRNMVRMATAFEDLRERCQS